MADYAKTGFDAPRISGYDAQRSLSPMWLRNVVQSQIWVDGEGVTDGFSAQADGAEIRVLKHNPVTGNPRTLGPLGETNRGHLRDSLDDYTEPTSQAYGIHPVHIYDLPHEIAVSVEDMIPLDVLNRESLKIEQRLRTLVNSFTLATKIAAVVNYAEDEDYDDNIIEVSDDDVLEALQEAHGELDKGDADNGIDVFPLEGRIAVLSPTGKQKFLKTDSSIYQLGSSQALNMIEIGSGGATASPNQVNTHIRGYFGHFMGAPMFMMAQQVIKVAGEWLGIEDDLTQKIYGVLSAAESTGRAFAMPERQKIQDSQRSYGLTIVPHVRWGATVFYPKGVVFLVNDKSDFKGLIPEDDDELKVIGMKSRE